MNTTLVTQKVELPVNINGEHKQVEKNEDYSILNKYVAFPNRQLAFGRHCKSRKLLQKPVLKKHSINQPIIRNNAQRYVACVKA